QQAAEEVSEQEELQLEQELQQIKELKARDTEVRTHEQAHAAVGGQYAGSPSDEYQRGPDGTNYAVGGEVPIDVGVITGDPQATIDKMQT
ncbi:putative metalloprotease CJM1_0395 family protein, partial [Psychrobacter sp. SIMBA_152]